MNHADPAEHPSPDDDAVQLGPCCACGGGAAVRTIVVLQHQNAIPGRGWGCAQCSLPPDGAIAVLCDPCTTAYQSGKPLLMTLMTACRGWPAHDGREPIAVTRARPAHDHDRSKHPEVPA